MADPIAKPAFPLGRTLAIVSAVCLAVGIAAWFAVPALFAEAEGAEAAVALMVGVVWVTAVVSAALVPMNVAAGPLGVVKAFFLGMFLRVVASLAALVIAIKVLNLPGGPLAVGLMAAYLPVLLVETQLIVGFARKFDRPTDDGGSAADDTTQPGRRKEAMA